MLVSPNVFLTAQHYSPSSTQGLTFYEGNDPSANPISIGIGGSQQIGNTDLRIGYLDSAVPSTIDFYSYATAPLSQASFQGSSYFNASAILTGLTPTTTGYGDSSVTDTSHGQNRLEGFVDGFEVGSSVGDALVTIKNLPTDGIYGYTYETYETDLNGGDSGGPLFRDTGSGLELVGISWASGTGTITGRGLPDAQRDISLYTYTGNYAADIQSYIDSHPAVVSPVPEPSMGLFALCGLFLLRRVRA